MPARRHRAQPDRCGRLDRHGGLVQSARDSCGRSFGHVGDEDAARRHAGAEFDGCQTAQALTGTAAQLGNFLQAHDGRTQPRNAGEQ